MNSENTEVVSVSRKAGSLRRISTSSGRVFLVLEGPRADRFLMQGAVLEQSDLEELEGPLAEAAGLSLALRILSRRERTEKEVRDKLRAEGIENPDVLAYIVGTLKGKNLLDDRRFASELIEYRLRHRPAGPALLKRRLTDAGVSAGIAEELIGDAFPPGEEERIAKGLALDRLRRGRPIGIPENRDRPRMEESIKDRTGQSGARSERERSVRRIGGFLSRRGFSAGVVGKVCAAVLSGEITGETNEQ